MSANALHYLIPHHVQVDEQGRRGGAVEDLHYPIADVHHCKGFMMNLVSRLAGAHEKIAQSRIRRLLVKGRVATISGIFQDP